jgi:regulator of sirC expression with transglutaminase-like and TPR domain
MREEQLIRSFVAAAEGPEDELAPAALLLGRIDYPRLDVSRYLDHLDALGADARARLTFEAAPSDPRDRIATLNSFLFEELGFAGNRDEYEDPRNSFLNQVLERRTGIPISLAVVYIEVARRAGLRIQGVNFPGHFLLRYTHAPGSRGKDLIIDAFNGGALLSERDCRELLREQVGEDVPFHRQLLAPARKRQILFRMLGNLKRVYVKLRSFPQARGVTGLMLALEPDSVADLRDRGLLSYHLQDFSAALHDLEMYLRLTARTDPDPQNREEFDQIWEHVKALRRRVASFN